MMDLVFLEHLNLISNHIESISEVEALMPVSVCIMYIYNVYCVYIYSV